VQNDTSLHVEDLVREMRRLLLDSQQYLAQDTRKEVEGTLHRARRRRMAEIRDELAVLKRNIQELSLR
jgi:hypothetical protein